MNDKFAEAQPEAIVGKSLAGARLAKRTLPTVGEQSLRNLPTLAQLLCATWEGTSKHANPAKSQTRKNYPKTIDFFHI